ncbi:MAG TPA: hypothetical protein VK753_11135 [Xanthomonadaceae bacterium]|jgi:hypothetical protein|nr:hypothetical protein [Xanthomonadaceae bacterium]
MSDDKAPEDDQQPAGEAPEILRSDPQQVREMQRWAIAVAVAAATLWLLFRYWIQHDNAYVVLHRMFGLCYGLSVLLLAVAVYTVRYARRIFDAGQYPPPGGWVLGDTRVLRGDAARARGRWVIVCAIVLALLGFYAAYLPHSIDAMRIAEPVQMPMHVGPHG